MVLASAQSGEWQVSAGAMKTSADEMLITMEHLPNEEIEVGELLYIVDVHAANIVKDIRENIRNLVGGRMPHYESLIRVAVDSALNDLKVAAFERGYDGVVGVKISHPSLVEGGVEVIVYGNGFRFAEPRVKGQGARV